MRANLDKLPFIRKNHIPWIIWSIAGLFYFYEIILRMLPGTMPTELMNIFHVNATQLGVFTASYYLSYTLMQIPAGLIVDRFSVRRTLLFATSLCISGFALVHMSDYLGFAEAGRFIIGFGSAFAYVSALKVASIWLPKNHFGLASCIVDSIGMIGAIFTDYVLVRINISSGYQSSVMLLLVTGALVALLIFFIFSDAPEDKEETLAESVYRSDHTNILEKLITISKNPQIWLIGIVGLLFYLPSSVLGDVWGLPYLHHVYKLDKTQTSLIMVSFFAGWTIVGPFLGAISDKLQKRCMPVILTILLDAILFSIVIFTPKLSGHILSFEILLAIFFFIGVATGTHPLVFALAKENYRIQIAGTVIAFTNTLIMLGGLLFQPLVGYLLDLHHGSVGLSYTIQQYNANDYTFALSIIPISLIICIILMLFIKETGQSLNVREEEDWGPNSTQ